MEIRRSDAFERDYKKLPHDLKQRVEKALHFLITDPRHPSLRAKIVDPTNRVWQARVTKGYRFYFTMETGIIVLHRVYNPHD